ncbi:MAG TPA: hypothetical protein VFF89_03310 [Sphingobium sp.]|nr:hypothetical protein [Sphingobium sp.]
MKPVENYCAAMVALLSDVELLWRVERLSADEQTPMHMALRKEVQRRGLHRNLPSN